MATIRIATRGSPLAMWQANEVAARLRAAHDHLTVELVEVKTQGDLNVSAALTSLGGIGVFTKEVQNAVLEDRADAAVHSLKDLPTAPVPGLSLAAVPLRGAVQDALVSLRYSSWRAMPNGARIGTGSPRRRGQLLVQRPDLTVVDLRGNVDTRLAKLEAESLDAIVLAVAGLERLGLVERITDRLTLECMLPAVGQGALGIECRADDRFTQGLLAPLEHMPTRYCVTAERAMLRALGAGCQMPVAALAEYRDTALVLRARVVEVRGRQCLEAVAESIPDKATELGEAVAKELSQQGAQSLLQAISS